jgi:lipoprotein signal peptidase
MDGLADGYFSFQKMISPTLIKVVYVIGVVGIMVAAIYMVFAGTKETEDTAKLVKVLSALLLATVGNLLWRLVCEQVILLFSIHERLASIDRSLKTR